MPNKDIKEEIAGYAHYNYPKNETIERLLRDGFTQEEIDTHLPAQFDAIDANNITNLWCFLPSSVYMIFLCIGALYGVYTADDWWYKLLFLLPFIGLAFITKRYYKEKKESVIIVMVLLFLGLLYTIYTFVSDLVTHASDSVFYYVVLGLLALWLYSLVKGNYTLYLKKKS